MLANYVLGCVYRDLHEVPLALEYYNKATEQADTTATDCDYGTLYRVYSQMGFIFSKQYLPYQILRRFSKAEKYAYLAKDTLNAYYKCIKIKKVHIIIWEKKILLSQLICVLQACFQTIWE